MRFTKISIDGFGRFTDTEMELAPGFQVVAGPNERGKSTLRYFISDMLYGQKRSTTRRLYDEGNELRAPWKTEFGYGGRLVYTLDSGQEIEVQRSFAADTESVTVFDRTNAQDITDTFPRLKNRESTFAEQHLHMTKAVFQGVATISHVSLSDLGDKQALVHIREKLQSLTDSASEDQSAEKALKWLTDRMTTIGQPQARTKPLPVMRHRLTDLQAEFQEVYEAAKEIAVYEKQRIAVLDEIGSLRNRRATRERQIAQIERAERADIVRRAASIAQRIEELTKACFALGDVREFPYERAGEVERLATLRESMQEKVTQAQENLDALIRERDEAIGRLEEQGVPLMKEADPDMESRLAELDKEIGLVNDRVEQLEQTSGRAATMAGEAQKTLESLPDFAQFLPDPLQHFTGLAGDYDVARRSLDEAERRQSELVARVSTQDKKLESTRLRFADRPDFHAELREYEARLQDTSESDRQRVRDRQVLTQQAEDLVSRFPGFVVMAVGGAVGGIALAIIGGVTGNSGIYLSSGILAAMALFFLVSALMNRRTLAGVRVASTDIDADDAAAQTGDESIRNMMAEAGCANLRELEAQYDRYRESERTLQSLRDRIEEQEKEVAATRGRRDTALDALGAALANAGEPSSDTLDPEAAVQRVLTRYQEYRDAKRRVGEAGEAQERATHEWAEARSRLDALREEDLEVSLQVRQFLRENHYPEEEKYESAWKALRNYRIKSAQMQAKQSELNVVQGQIKVLRRECETGQAEAEEIETELRQILDSVEVDSVETYRAQAKNARKYHEMWRERSSLEDQLDAVVGDHDLKKLRNEMQAEGDSVVTVEGDIGEMKAELAGVQEQLDSKRKQEHALQLMIAERSAGRRSMNEVDEERAATEQRVAELEQELKAAECTIEIIQEVTRERHSRIAPKLAEGASSFLQQITSEAYDELLVDQDMQISVRIPQTRAMNADPERRLSKGTVDQIYFALRLAMIRQMSEHDESVPMVLDDPFANYDDDRLLNAMRLLAKVGEANQVLLFTCREDVVRAAESVNTPIIRL